MNPGKLRDSRGRIRMQRAERRTCRNGRMLLSSSMTKHPLHLPRKIWLSLSARWTHISAHAALTSFIHKAPCFLLTWILTEPIYRGCHRSQGGTCALHPSLSGLLGRKIQGSLLGVAPCSWGRLLDWWITEGTESLEVCGYFSFGFLPCGKAGLIKMGFLSLFFGHSWCSSVAERSVYFDPAALDVSFESLLTKLLELKKLDANQPKTTTYWRILLNLNMRFLIEALVLVFHYAGLASIQKELNKKKKKRENASFWC